MLLVARISLFHRYGALCRQLNCRILRLLDFCLQYLTSVALSAFLWSNSFGRCHWTSCCCSCLRQSISRARFLHFRIKRRERAFTFCLINVLSYLMVIFLPYNWFFCNVVKQGGNWFLLLVSIRWPKHLSMAVQLINLSLKMTFFVSWWGTKVVGDAQVSLVYRRYLLDWRFLFGSRRSKTEMRLCSFDVGLLIHTEHRAFLLELKLHVWVIIFLEFLGGTLLVRSFFRAGSR